jgi:ABC-2 type transport system ATP-binding protein
VNSRFYWTNGAGRATTFKCLIGAYAKWNGDIKIYGLKNNCIDAKRKIGYIPENPRFPKKFSAFEYLVIMARLFGVNKDDAEKFAIDKLKEFNIWNLQKKSPNTFSSGQKKKILLAQALIHNPDLILMDEPVAT